jgi:hypothetical protein
VALKLLLQKKGGQVSQSDKEKLHKIHREIIVRVIFLEKTKGLQHVVEVNEEDMEEEEVIMKIEVVAEAEEILEKV